MWELYAKFCNNIFENVGFKKETAFHSDLNTDLNAYNFAHNPFKSNNYDYNWQNSDTSCTYGTDNGTPTGSHWKVNFDGGPVHIYSVSFLAFAETYDSLDGVKIYVDDVHCNTITGA